MVKVRKDLTGMRFGRLTVVKRVEDYVSTSASNRVYAQYLCKCDCGNELVVHGQNLTCTNGVKSCGCLKNKCLVNDINLTEVTNARNYLCEYYGRKCLTSEHGKCPMTKYFCYEYPTVSYMLSKISNRENGIKLINYLMKSAKELGYVAE